MLIIAKQTQPARELSVIERSRLARFLRRTPRVRLLNPRAPVYSQPMQTIEREESEPELALQTLLTLDDERASLPRSEQLLAGANIRIDRSQKGKAILHADSRIVLAGGSKGQGGVSSWNELTDKPTTIAGFGITDAAQIQYLVQVEAIRHWTAAELVYGSNVIGVREAGASVYLPHDLPPRILVTVKDETGQGAVVFPY